MKKLYSVQFAANGVKAPDKRWFNFIFAEAVSKSYAKGFVAGIRQSYPCPDLRIIDYHTKEVIETTTGNGEVKPS